MNLKSTLSRANYSAPKPTVCLDEKDLPEIKDWKVGGKYTITLDVEQVSAEKGEYDDSKKLSARFKILKAYAED